MFPDFKLEYNLESGMKELFEKYAEHKFTQDDFEGEQFVRLKTLRKRLNLIKAN